MTAEVNAAGDVPSAAETTLGKGLSFWFLVSGYSGAPVLLPGEHLVAAVVKMLSSVYIVFDFELAYGRILERL